MSKSPGVQPARIYQLHDSDSAEDLYRDWAEKYDEDLLGEMGWEGHRIVAHRISGLVSNRGANILDAGCGTGLCGEALRDHGFCNLIGVDLTQAMLDVAHQKQIYRQLQIVDLTQPLPFPDAGFDVICSAGVFSHGPVLPEHMSLLLAPLVDRGLCVHTINGLAYEKIPYCKTLEEMNDRGEIELVEDKPIAYTVGTGTPGWLVVFRKGLAA